MQVWRVVNCKYQKKTEKKVKSRKRFTICLLRMIFVFHL